MDPVYEDAHHALTGVINKRGSVKSLCLAPKVGNKRAVYAVVVETLRWRPVIEAVLCGAGVSVGDEVLPKALAWMLTYELLFGRKKKISGDRTPGIDRILRARSKLRSALDSMMTEKGVTVLFHPPARCACLGQ
jgi:25S rRNA (cytosine2278-C5)-methyltransferase